MNQPDANYWLSLAAQWIQSKSQTQLNFPNYPFSPAFPQEIHLIPQAPEPPKISGNDATINDNLVEADMDIEDDVREDDRPPQNWAAPNWQSGNEKVAEAPVVTNNHAAATKHPPVKLPSNRSDSFSSSRFTHAPCAPIISESSHQSVPVDMVLDSDEAEDDNNSSTQMEAQRRKKLPVWIREGLERIEREKKLEVQRLQREKEVKKDAENRKRIMEEALKELEREKLIRSKYDSESEDEDKPHRDTPETEPKFPPRQPIPDIQDDEEAYEQMMLLVRKTLTEILLEVTDEKIQEISSETLSKYRRKGLGAYSNSTDDEDSDAVDSEKADEQEESGWEPEHVLKERIRVKSIAFEQRAKEIKERLAKIAEAEQERFSRKKEKTEAAQEHSKFDFDSDTPQKPRKVDGEEKFEQIYSISSSFAPSGRHRDKKKTRFNDPKDARASGILLTHVGMMETVKPGDNGTSSGLSAPLFPLAEALAKRKHESSTSSASSSSSSRHKKQKHKKSASKRSKKSSKKRERSRSRDRDKRKSHKSDRHSIESKSSDSRRRRSRSRSRSHDRRNRSRRY